MMAKDAFDRWWQWAEKPTDSPAHLSEMQLPPDQRRYRAAVE